MIDITTIQNGFLMWEQPYLFEGQTEIVSESQCNVPTDKGIILLDLSCSINEVFYTNINLFIQALTN
jgi:hypothetical protein